MEKSAVRISDHPRGAVLAVRVTPRAKKNQVTQIMADGTVKITLTAPPVEGKANAALMKFLAEILHVPAASIEITAGASGRSKLVTVASLDVDVARERIAGLLAKQG